MKTQYKANERTFQGVLLSAINDILKNSDDIGFSDVTQEQNIGTSRQSRFADGLLHSARDTTKRVLIELKNSSWDATDEKLVFDAMMKAANLGISYFVTGTPRQMVVWQTFKPNTLLGDRKLKIFPLVNVKSDNDVLSDVYKSKITSKLRDFLKELDAIVHEQKAVVWDTIDRVYVNKLSNYILEAANEMFPIMYREISDSKTLQRELRQYLLEQDIFNVSTAFDMEDVYNLCLLANYMLYLKLIFYSYLQRDVPSLNLQKLKIPQDAQELNILLRNRFDDVLKHDFELIFSPSPLDKFVFPDKYLPALQYNVEEMSSLNFSQLTGDIIGGIYNTLIDNQEQHDRGQHFTNTNEVDLVNAFCINENTKVVIDTGCGAGTFLVRAYSFLKYFDKKLSHEELLTRIWGIEIGLFPSFLATMNLSLLSVQTLKNYPIIVHSDFADIASSTVVKVKAAGTMTLAKVRKLSGDAMKVSLPQFDACIGNPPYIRQELIQNKEVWATLAEKEWGIKKINLQSDLFVYYTMHTAAFLKEGGRLGYVVSSSWLDGSFGAGMQKFLLDNFKIIAIIEHQSKRSFETASVNTVILIVERCSSRQEREANTVRFVRAFWDYDDLFSKAHDDEHRIAIARNIATHLESIVSDTDDEFFLLTARNQKELLEESTIGGKYTNGNWGAKYLRSPLIYQKIIAKGKNKLTRLGSHASVFYGIKSGANDFFYVKDNTKEAQQLSPEEFNRIFGSRSVDFKRYGWYWSDMNNRHYLIERKFILPLFKSQRQAQKLGINTAELDTSIVVCNEKKDTLRTYKYKILQYVEDAETFDIHKRPSCKQRVITAAQAKQRGTKQREWYMLGEIPVGEFIFPSKIGEYYRLIDNRDTKVICDKVSYNITPHNSKHADILFALLNSITFRFLVDLFARQLTGAQTLSDVDVNVVERTLIPNPELLEPYEDEIKHIICSLKEREQKSIFEEVNEPDKRRLDEIIFEVLGLPKSAVDELYKEATEYVRSRAEKSESVQGVAKVKKGMNFDEALQFIKDRFPDIRTMKQLIGSSTTKEVFIPNYPAQFPDYTQQTLSMFAQSYKAYFKQTANLKTVLTFDAKEEAILVEFLYKQIDCKGETVLIPTDEKICEGLLHDLSEDHSAYFEQITSLLKHMRCKVNSTSIWKAIVMEE